MLPDFQITPEEGKQILDSGDAYLLIDIREPVEYEQRHIRGAILMPLGQSHIWWRTLPRNRLLLFYCDGSERADELCIELTKKGFTDIKSMVGGINAWHYNTVSSKLK